MAAAETDAIVLRYSDYKEADRIITLFSPEQGKITAAVRGVKKTTSKLRFAAELLHYGRYIFNESKGRYTVVSCTTKESFYDVRFDVDRLWCATFMLNAAEKIIVEGQRDEALFLHLLKGLYEITYRQGGSVLGIAAAYLSGVLRAEGCAPELAACQECGGKEPAFFDIQSGGVLCRDCAQCTADRTFKMDGGLLDALRRLFAAPEVFRAAEGCSLRQNKAAFACLLAYTADRFECRFKSADYLLSLDR